MVREWDLSLVDKESGAPKQLQNAVVRYVMAQSLAGPPIIDVTGAPTIVLVDAAQGMMQVKLSADDTQNLPYGRVVHQIIVTDPEGDPDVLLEGYGEVLPVIRAT